MNIRVPVWIVALGLPACLSFSYVTVDRQTALENQILGAYAELNRDLVLVASERGLGAGADATDSPERRRAVRAMLRRRYNLDDLTDLKRAGCVGEGRDGRMYARPCTWPSVDPGWRTRAPAVIAEENDDREAVLQRIVEINPDLDADDLPDLRNAFAALNRQAAAAGEYVQDDAGAWVRKP